MSTVDLHQIDPDGDVDLILQRPKELKLSLSDEKVFEYMLIRQQLGFRRSGREDPCSTTGIQESRRTTDFTIWTSKGKEWKPKGKARKKEKGKGKLPKVGSYGLDFESTETEPHLYGEPAAGRVPEPPPESPTPDIPPETSTITKGNTVSVSGEPSDDNSQGKESVKEEASSISGHDCVRIRVSSKHLALASSYFRRNLRSGMLESKTIGSEGRVKFHMDELDSGAMLIAMNIIHGRTRQVPRSVDLELLTKLAVLVDYLECHESIEPFSDGWIDGLKAGIPITY